MKIDYGSNVAESHGLERSPKWDSVRKAHLKIEPQCVACKQKSLLHRIVTLQFLRPSQVHHCIPFHLCVLLGRPDLELDQRNLISLCEDPVKAHHLLVGHLASYQSYDPTVQKDALRFRGKTADEIHLSPEWKAWAFKRPKDWAHMSDKEKADLRVLMDKTYPKL